MKHFSTWVNTKENGAYQIKATANSEAEALTNAVLEVVENDLCFEALKDEHRKQVEDLFNSEEFGQVFIQDPDCDVNSGVVVWKLDGYTGVGHTSNGDHTGTDKWENKWFECSFIKEQLETVTYIVQDEDLDRLDDVSIPETMEMGVFRYSNGEIKVESL